MSGSNNSLSKGLIIKSLFLIIQFAPNLLNSFNTIWNENRDNEDFLNNIENGNITLVKWEEEKFSITRKIIEGNQPILSFYK